MGSDVFTPPVPTAASLVGLGEDEYEILSHVMEKLARGAMKEKKKDAAPEEAAEDEKDRNFFSLLGASFVRWFRHLPAWLKRNWIPLAITAAVWILVHVLADLLDIGFAKTVVFFVGGLTASFNNFLGKAVFAGVIAGVVLPLYRFYKQSGVKDVVAKYRKVRQLLRRASKELGHRSWKVVLASAGVGLVAANVLSTNNGLSMAFVSVLAAFALVNSLAFGTADGVRDRLFRAAYRDVAGLFGKRRLPSHGMARTVVASLAAGLAGSVVPTLFMAPYTVVAALRDTSPPEFLMGFPAYAGYAFGGAFVLVAILLHFVLREKPGTTPEAAAPASAS